MSTAPPALDWKQYEFIEQKFPDVWRRCYPRRYDDTGRGQYDSPKAVARAMMDAYLNYYGTLQIGPGQTEQSEAAWAALMSRYTVPTYYLSHDIAVALTQTSPSETLDCLSIKLPFPAAAYMLPKGVLVHPEYGDISFVGYSRTAGDTEIDCLLPFGFKHTLVVPPGAGTFTIYVRTVSGIMLHWSYSPNMRMIDLRDEQTMEALQKQYSHSSRGIDAFFQNFTPADIALMIRAIKLTFNIILFTTHKPELVEPAQLLKRVKKGQAEFIEYWRPHIIGRSYKLRYESHGTGHGTHASPRGHWVSGFWREQPYGPQRSQRKTLWIEPYWRGGDV